jgi:hypothetical protein
MPNSAKRAQDKWLAKKVKDFDLKKFKANKKAKKKK